MNVPEKGSRHAALDMGCDTCHVTHKTGERGKQEFDYPPDQGELRRFVSIATTRKTPR